MGGHCLLLMGDMSSWELVKLMFFFKNLIRNRSFGERFLLKFSMISSDGFNHGLPVVPHKAVAEVSE